MSSRTQYHFEFAVIYVVEWFSLSLNNSLLTLYILFLWNIFFFHLLIKQCLCKLLHFLLLIGVLFIFNFTVSFTLFSHFCLTPKFSHIFICVVLTDFITCLLFTFHINTLCSAFSLEISFRNYRKQLPLSLRLNFRTPVFIQAAAYCNVKGVMRSGKINFLLWVNSNDTSYLFYGFLLWRNYNIKTNILLNLFPYKSWFSFWNPSVRRRISHLAQENNVMSVVSTH